MRIYEELFIVKPDTPEEEIDGLTGQLEGVINQSGGKLDKTEKWGARKLAYRVKKHNDGFYILLQFHAAPETVREIERRLRVSDLVIKYLTVRMDEKLQWLERRKKAREARAARRPAPPPQATPSSPAAPGPGAPAPSGPAPGAPAPGAPAAAAPAEPARPPAEPSREVSPREVSREPAPAGEKQ